MDQLAIAEAFPFREDTVCLTGSPSCLPKYARELNDIEMVWHNNLLDCPANLGRGRRQAKRVKEPKWYQPRTLSSVRWFRTGSHDVQLLST
jgi:hypothetical protein